MGAHVVWVNVECHCREGRKKGQDTLCNRVVHTVVRKMAAFNRMTAVRNLRQTLLREGHTLVDGPPVKDGLRVAWNVVMG